MRARESRAAKARPREAFLQVAVCGNPGGTLMQRRRILGAKTPIDGQRYQRRQGARHAPAFKRLCEGATLSEVHSRMRAVEDTPAHPDPSHKRSFVSARNPLDADARPATLPISQKRVS